MALVYCILVSILLSIIFNDLFHWFVDVDDSIIVVVFVVVVDLLSMNKGKYRFLNTALSQSPSPSSPSSP